MPEAITKYAVNSTLGTEKFQPLDKIVVGEKRFIVNETPIALLAENKKITNRERNDDDFQDFALFKPQIDGLVRIKIKLSTSSMNSHNVKVNVLKGATSTKTISNSGEVEFEFDLNVSAGASYIFQMIESGNSTSTIATIESCYLCAQVTDYSHFEYSSL